MLLMVTQWPLILAVLALLLGLAVAMIPSALAVRTSHANLVPSLAQAAHV